MSVSFVLLWLLLCLLIPSQRRVGASLAVTVKTNLLLINSPCKISIKQTTDYSAGPLISQEPMWFNMNLIGTTKEADSQPQPSTLLSLAASSLWSLHTTGLFRCRLIHIKHVGYEQSRKVTYIKSVKPLENLYRVTLQLGWICQRNIVYGVKLMSFLLINLPVVKWYEHFQIFQTVRCCDHILFGIKNHVNEWKWTLSNDKHD